MNILPVILSGGSGTRLWPLSRAEFPKQIQPLCGNASLLQQTAERLPCSENVFSPLIVCNEEQRFLVAEQLREVGITPSAIILEPMGRNTAPAIGVAALWPQKVQETVLVVMPSDHFVADVPAFRQTIEKAVFLAAKGMIVTLGITPTTPHTGFGYIEKGPALQEAPFAHAVTQFKEKPDEATARSYLATGRYDWNAGIFVFRADVFTQTLEALQPTIASACQAALAAAQQDLDFLRLNAEAFARAPNLSVDYAVMEHAKNVCVVPSSFGWSDVGTWASLWEIGTKDANSNVILGDVILRDVKNAYVRAERHLVSVIGLENIVVVDTPDALFITDKARADETKEIVEVLKKKGRPEGVSPLRVWRPWGYYERIDQGQGYQVKQIMVKPGGKLSLQMHHHRAEHWIIVRGTGRVTCGERVALLGPNESIYIPLGEKHQLENPGKTPLYLIEVQSGDYLGEDDIVRFEDVYGRA